MSGDSASFYLLDERIQRFIGKGMNLIYLGNNIFH